MTTKKDVQSSVENFADQAQREAEDARGLVCGVIMPISGNTEYASSHWDDVRSILYNSIRDAGFEPSIVSDADDSGLIHKRIVQNLYDNPIVVCDVSSRNPNVMFELGIRLAFDKPTIIVKDESTPYSFDTSAIEHVDYPRDLRFSKIVAFKQKLSDKIRDTHRAAKNNPDYTTFLKHFGEFKVGRIEKKEVSGQEFILEEIKALRLDLKNTLRSPKITPLTPLRETSMHFDLIINNADQVTSLANKIMKVPGVISVRTIPTTAGKTNMNIKISPSADLREATMVVKEALEDYI